MTASSRPFPGPTTVDPEDVARFSAIAEQWWDENGKFRPLHRLNPVRLAYIRDVVCRRLGRDPLAAQPLAGLRLADVGCGGGLLAEPLARMGAEVTGIDASAKNIGTASVHAAQSGVKVDYRASTAEELAASGEKFDLVTCLEVIEHVADVKLFVKSLGQLLAPGGALFLATLNRTPKSWLFAIVGAEYVLRWLPKGTHDWNKFLRPSELAALLRAEGMAFGDLTGVTYEPFGGTFRTDARDLDVNYMGWAEKR